MISAKFWVRSALAVAAITVAGGAQAAVTYGWSSPNGGTAYDVPTDPTNGFTYVGGGSTNSVSSGAVANTSFNVPNFISGGQDYYITSALLTVYLADDGDTADEEAGIKVRSGAAAWTTLTDDKTIDSTGYLKSVTHQAAASGMGTNGSNTNPFEVDGRQCTSGNVTNTTCRTGYYDSYTFEVKTLIKEGQAFDLSVFRSAADKTDDFWYKGAFLTLTTAKVVVPEPATLGLLGLGLIGIGLSRRRKLA